MLFVGNSLTFTNDLPGHVHALEPRLDVDSVTVGGASLLDHIRADTAAARIRDGHFTDVVLQERTYEPVFNPAGFRDAATRLVELVSASGARPFLFEPWAHRDASDPMYEQAWSGGSPAAMQWRLHEAVGSVARDTHAVLLPIGQAFAQMRVLHPELAMYVPDGNHPALAGTYVAACVVLEAITDTPVGDDAPVPKGLARRDAETLRRAAHQAVIAR